MIEKAKESVALAPYNYYDEKSRKNWDIVHTAIKDETQLRLNYLSLDDQKSERKIYPLGMFYWGGVWTLGAWCFLREAYRNFRVDRIEDITLVKKLSVLPQHVSLNDYIQEQKTHY